MTMESPSFLNQPNNDEVDEIRKSNKKVQRQELKKVNAVADTFVFEGVHKGIENLKSKLSLEDIQREDAQKMDELKTKKQQGILSPAEEAELNIRESGELFVSRELYREYGGSDQLDETGGGIKEMNYFKDVIRGTQNGESIFLTRYAFPKFTDETLGIELEKKEAFRIEDWKGAIGYMYEGIVEKKPVSSEEAEKLFNSYYDIALTRTKELQKAKEKEEIKKLGHTL